MKINEYAWAQKYRPQKIDDIILKEEHEKLFKNIIKEGDIPDLLLCGIQGAGKTTIAKVLCNELSIPAGDVFFLNGRTDCNMDNLKTEIIPFLSTKSFTKNGKVIIIDEADGSTLAVLDSLKTLIEKHSSNVSFIMTSNHINKFKDAIKSRLYTVNFSINNKNDKDILIKKTFKRVMTILKNEGVIVEDNKELIKFISIHIPDIRHIIKTLQIFSISNEKIIPANICASDNNAYKPEVFKEMINKFNYDEIVKFVENSNTEMLYMFIQDNLKELCKPENFYDVLKIINIYSFQEAFTTIKNANTICCLSELRAFIK